MDQADYLPQGVITYTYSAGDWPPVPGGAGGLVVTYTYDQNGGIDPSADEPIYREEERKFPEDDDKPPG